MYFVVKKAITWSASGDIEESMEGVVGNEATSDKEMGT